MGGRYVVDTVAFFSCPRGFNLVGPSVSKCKTSGIWTHATPSCNQSNQNTIIIICVYVYADNRNIKWHNSTIKAQTSIDYKHNRV